MPVGPTVKRKGQIVRKGEVTPPAVLPPKPPVDPFAHLSGKVKSGAIAHAKAVARREAEAARRAAGEVPTSASPAVGASTKTLADLIARWRVAPWLFVREEFGVVPDFWQDEALHALVEGNFQLALKACKGPGKSALLAWVIWWFMLCFSHPKILVTSITGENLRDGLWAELAKWRQKSQLLQALFEWQSEKIYSFEYPETWFASARTWPKDADKTKQANTLAGQHAQNSMIVLDEAGGIPVGVLIAGLAHHSTQDPTVREVHYTLLAGNPESLDSALGWACTEDAEHWWVKEITGDPDDPRRSPRIDKEWARRQIDKLTRENPWVMVNIFGKFPPISLNKLLGSDHVRAAMEVQIPEQLYIRSPRIMALDVARSTSRDRSVLCRRQGPIIFPFLTYRLDDTNELAGQVAFEFARWPAKLVIVDMVGIGGGVFDHLKALGLPVVGFNGGLPARAQQFKDRRTETWWNCAQDIKGSAGVPLISLPRQAQELIPELTAPNVQYGRDGRMKLESKEDMLKRGVNSPDVADALTMTYAEFVFEEPDVPESTREALKAGKVKVDYDPLEVEQ